jgi:hypothetical protein
MTSLQVLEPAVSRLRYFLSAFSLEETGLSSGLPYELCAPLAPWTIVSYASAVLLVLGVRSR